MAFYTMIIDWQGGTYVLQGVGGSRHEAALKCLENWDISAINNIINPPMKHKIRDALIKDKHEGLDFAALNGLTHIWAHSVMLDGSMILMNLILTQDISK